MPPNVKAAQDALKDFQGVEVEPDTTATEAADIAPELPEPKDRRQSKISRELENLYTTVGTMVYMVQPRVGHTIVTEANKCAESLDELARTNPRVRRALESVLTTSAWSGVIVAHMPILMVLAYEYVPAFKQIQAEAPPEPSEPSQNGQQYYTSS
jgi:hypothetical protein